jgi:alkanesulfonate monooxygenase SsuD/methylene tetrahydromethanopterin reductase-like flavin-dependent oxidoreductase (luciferase family)
MELDLLYEVDLPRPWGDEPHPWAQRRREQEAYDSVIEQIKRADDVGFNIAWFVEHHFREGRSHCPSPEVLLGALTQLTKNIRLGFGVTLLPFGFTHPARVAEKVATADILSRGRIEWGTGRSTPQEQAAFHVDRQKSRSEWEEAIRIITAMWRDEYFEYESPTFQFPRRMVTPKPYQVPHPPCWMAATSEESSRVAGMNQLGLLSLSLNRPLEQMASQINAYREAWKDPDSKPLADAPNSRVAAYTVVYCAPSMEQAEEDNIWENVGWWYTSTAEFILEWEFPLITQEERDKRFPQLRPLADGIVPVKEFHEADMVIVGDPERCLEKMKRYADYGVDEILCRIEFGHLSHESKMRTLELLGKEVLPELKTYVPATKAAN